MHSGVLGERLRKVVRMGMKHVKQCMVSGRVLLLLQRPDCTVHVRL